MSSVDHEAYHSFEKRTQPAASELRPYQIIGLDISTALPDSVELMSRTGLSGEYVAGIRAGDRYFYVLRPLDRGQSDLLVIDDSFSIEQGSGYHHLTPETPLTVGRRTTHQNSFSHSESVSRDHFVVSYENDRVYIGSLEPSNPTTVFGYASGEQPDEALDQLAIGNTLQSYKAAPQTYSADAFPPAPDVKMYLGAAEITPDARSVGGKVYRSGHVDKIGNILIDDNNVFMRKAYADLVEKFVRERRRGKKMNAFQLVVAVGGHAFRHLQDDTRKTNDIMRRYQPHGMVMLSRFVRRKVGNTWHRDAMTASLFENLINDGIVYGFLGTTMPADMTSTPKSDWQVWESALQVDGKPYIRAAVDASRMFHGYNHTEHK